MSGVDLAAWLGRVESGFDVAGEGVLHRLAALLDYEDPPWRSGEVPPLAHWLYFLPDTRQSELDGDGHPRRGGFLPPVAQAHRMWAGGRISIHRRIPIGEPIERSSTIANIASKAGSNGPMVFVTVKHVISAKGMSIEPAIEEEQDIVYRQASGPALSRAPRGEDDRPADVTRSYLPDPLKLFRFSALTFNAHRIHYDREYARCSEGYPGLVVQGPYLAILLMDLFLCGHPGATVSRFEFRARRAAFDGRPLLLCMAGSDRRAELWARDPEGSTTMTAVVEAG
jgi:3-methylfumaryl-CoA hydratase